VQNARVGQRRQDFLLRIMEVAHGGIGSGQIEQRPAAVAMTFKRLRQQIRIESPICA
jgi:hypothetical protein